MTLIRFAAVLCCLAPFLAAADDDLPKRSKPAGEQRNQEFWGRILDNYVGAIQQAQSVPRCARMDVKITGSLPKLEKTGVLKATRHIASTGQITYDTPSYTGDQAVKNELITRYLNAETQAHSLPSPELAVAPANYKFKFSGSIEIANQRWYIFQVSPRRKKVGLFKGEIWIDGNTFLPVRQTGRFVKSPSIFLSKVEFTQEFTIQDRASAPKSLSLEIDARLVGKAMLETEYTNFERLTDPEACAAPAKVKEASLR